MSPESAVDPRPTILVVDDAELFRDLESLFLASAGRIISASDGASGLALARSERPAVAVVDLHMPGLDGDLLCQEIKADPELREIPVVVVTSGSSPEDHERAVRAGANDIVTKPLNRLSLIQAVHRLMQPDEKRGMPRVPLDAEVRIRCHGGDAWGMARNVSRGGLFISAARPVPPNTEVELEFALPDNDTVLSPTARVIWNRADERGAPSGMGLRFLGLDPRAAARIDEFVYTHPACMATAANGAAGGQA